jgi:hypothetical protein
MARIESGDEKAKIRKDYGEESIDNLGAIVQEFAK